MIMAVPTRYTVTGPAVVLRTLGASGTDRYLYRGATVEARSFTKESIAHALGIGLIAKVNSEEESAAE